MLPGLNKGKKYFSNSPEKNLKISFNDWSKGYLYRTSYRNMNRNSPVKNKTCAVPGYTGHVPGAVSESTYGKKYSVITRELLARRQFPTRVTWNFPNRSVSLSPNTSRFKEGTLDEYQTVSRFHGKSTVPMTHPSHNEIWSTNYRNSYKNQEKLRRFLNRQTNAEINKKIKVIKKESSGFVQNSKLFDGYGWTPIKKLHGNLSYSEYRSRFNRDVEFHPSPLRAKFRKMNKKN